MATYVNKYVSDIPLKRPQETFVDEPCSIDDVNIHDLVFDLSHDIKNLDSLHVFHALAIFNKTLENLMKLAENETQFAEFRNQQLAANSIDLHHLQSLLENPDAVDTSFHDDDLPLPVKTPSRHSLDELVNELNQDPVSEIESARSSLDEPVPEDPSDSSDVGFISAESLVKTTSLDVSQDLITQHSAGRLEKEVLFHMAPRIKAQANHLLRAFTLAKVPGISVKQFLERIRTYSPSISASVYIHSAYMIYKLSVLLDVVKITPLNVYRFVLASVRCSTKKLDDVYQKQKSFATVGGVSLKDLCKMEVGFLYLFNFKMVVSKRILNDFATSEFVALTNFYDESSTSDTMNE